MLESKYQKKIIDKLESDGWYVIKLIKTNKNGIPDLFAVKENTCQFIEVKGANTPVSKLQEYRIKQLNDLGIPAKIMRYGVDAV